MMEVQTTLKTYNRAANSGYMRYLWRAPYRICTIARRNYLEAKLVFIGLAARAVSNAKRREKNQFFTENSN
jgi:hypothetical protein